jgi:D-aminoacyl-tRNA deacylase
MRALIQRVNRASVRVNGAVISSIDSGLLVLLGVQKNDTRVQAERLTRKIVNLRVFPDASGRMNSSVLREQKELLIVSQFTLCANLEGGNRPSFTDAAPAPQAELLYNLCVELCRATGVRVSTGQFQAHMDVELINNGPVTFLLDSE